MTKSVSFACHNITASWAKPYSLCLRIKSALLVPDDVSGSFISAHLTEIRITPWWNLFPINTGHGTLPHGFFNEVFWPALRLDYFRLFRLLIEFKYLWTDLLTAAATNALILINNYFPAHGSFPYIILPVPSS
jgi:hypothetical protein